MTSKENVTRISLSLPPELLERFDDVAVKSGFADRSKAVQATIRNFISDETHSLTPNQRVTAVIVVVYNHEARGIDGTLTDIEHEIADKITSSSHVHLGVTHCLKIIVLKGNVSEVTAFEKVVRKLKGVMQLKAMFVKTEMDLS
ncbi:MAG: CopG family ribbon-helix-helix protein [Candidatus Bathyarchaeia archaeon]